MGEKPRINADDARDIKRALLSGVKLFCDPVALARSLIEAFGAVDAAVSTPSESGDASAPTDTADLAALIGDCVEQWLIRQGEMATASELEASARAGASAAVALLARVVATPFAEPASTGLCSCFESPDRISQ
jgi:hypothetical protein